MRPAQRSADNDRRLHAGRASRRRAAYDKLYYVIDAERKWHFGWWCGAPSCCLLVGAIAPLRQMSTGRCDIGELGADRRRRKRQCGRSKIIHLPRHLRRLTQVAVLAGIASQPPARDVAHRAENVGAPDSQPVRPAHCTVCLGV